MNFAQRLGYAQLAVKLGLLLLLAGFTAMLLAPERLASIWVHALLGLGFLLAIVVSIALSRPALPTLCRTVLRRPLR